ncbi:MAG: hypothetical protein EXQ48_08090 [Acidobacteria bacterium]|nr:hypothetical protein [Acidobacteriota bacterium]
MIPCVPSYPPFERCPRDRINRIEDRVVPPAQSRLMADALRAKGLPVELLEFEGEQHGFRQADTIVRCLEAELSFYGATFGFSPADAPPADDVAGTRPARQPRC